MIDLDRISRQHLETKPYRWAVVDGLFSPPDAAALAKTFPRDHFKRLADYAGEKDFEYEAPGPDRHGRTLHLEARRAEHRMASAGERLPIARATVRPCPR
jgi:hypothetical protein